MGETLYHLKNIQKSFGGKKVLDISELEIPKGRFVSIVGYSGSGKSTLLNILGLLDEPDFQPNASLKINIGSSSFKVSFDDKCKWAISDGERKINLTEFRNKYIGFIFQDNYLPPHLKIGNLFRAFYNLKNAEIRNKMGLVSLPTIDNFLDKYPSTLSGSEAQRITILFAITKNPLILLTDEPTSNLDYQIGQGVLKVFQSWLKKRSEDRTVIMVSHHLHQICEFSDIIILLKDGKLIDVLDNSLKKISPDLLTKKMVEK